MRSTYGDGTPIVSPFWLISCTSCNHITWSTRKQNVCSECGEEAKSVPANQDNKKPV